MTEQDPRLARAKAYLAIAESKDSKREAYKRAAKEIVAYKNETNVTWMELASSIGRERHFVQKLVKWHDTGYQADTPFLMDTEATARAARSHAKKLLSDPNEAAKLLASLPTDTKQTLAGAIVDNPSMRRAVEDEQDSKHPALRPRPTNVGNVQQPLLHRIESDRVRLLGDAETMAGHWHDGRHDADDEELRLVRDSMAQAVIEVEQVITAALRGETAKEEV